MLTQDNIREQRAIALGLKSTASWEEIHFTQHARDTPSFIDRVLMFLGL